MAKENAMMQATWNGTVLARSADTVVVEGNHYFPASSLERDYFTASAKNTICPWKGTASYFSVTVGGVTNVDAAWFYPDPLPEASMVTDRVAFWRGVEVSAVSEV